MGLELEDLKLLVELREKFSAAGHAAILGDVKLHFSTGDIQDCAQRDLSFKGRYDESATLSHLKEILNFIKVETFDLFGKPDHKVDLHDPLKPEYLGRFDWVIDAGTMFCCFDVAAVWKNVLNLLKDRAYVFHLAGFAGYWGRSYYSFSPMLFRDFYESNGFEVYGIYTRVLPEVQPKKSAWPWGHMSEKRNYKWIKHSVEEVYLKSVGPDGLQLGATICRPEASTLPNNCLVGCFAYRESRKSFSPALPRFYRDRAKP